MTKSSGGEDLQSNYDVMCSECNHKKADTLELEKVLSEEMVKESFGEFGEYKYCCEITNDPGFFHTIVISSHTIFILEWIDDEDPEVLAATVYDLKCNRKSFADSSITNMIKNIKLYITEGALK